MFKVLGLLLEIVERYLVLAFLTMCAPMAFGMGGSKSTSDIFTGWCRMFASMCFVMMSNMLFFKLLLSLPGNVPTGLDVLVWIALVFGVVKVHGTGNAEERCRRKAKTPGPAYRSVMKNIILLRSHRQRLSMRSFFWKAQTFYSKQLYKAVSLEATGELYKIRTNNSYRTDNIRKINKKY